MEFCEFTQSENEAQRKYASLERLEALCWPRSSELLRLIDKSDSASDELDKALLKAVLKTVGHTECFEELASFLESVQTG